MYGDQTATRHQRVAIGKDPHAPEDPLRAPGVLGPRLDGTLELACLTVEIITNETNFAASKIWGKIPGIRACRRPILGRDSASSEPRGGRTPLRSTQAIAIALLRRKLATPRKLFSFFVSHSFLGLSVVKSTFRGVVHRHPREQDNE